MVIGITGGIGSGKSTASKLIEAKGYRRLDCDEIAHELLASDGKTREEVLAEFGKGVLGEGEGIDRKALGAIVFEDEKRLRALEAILHPKIRQAWESKISQAPEEDWIVEIPLLFEKNLENRVDFTVCVFTDLSTQVERLGRKGMARTQVLARINRQMPIPKKAEKADCVLLNDGSLEFLEDQVKQLLTLI